MRALLAVVLVAAAAWAGWWFVGRAGAEAAALAAEARLTAAGYPARHAGLKVAGFPNRFDVTLTDPQVAAPDGRWTWEAPFVQVFAMAWKPWHLIAAFPPDQRLALPGGEVRLTAGRLQASLVARPGGDLPLDRVVLAGDDLALATPQGAITATALRAATRATGADGRAHDLAVEVQGLGPGPTGWLRLRAELTLEAALDRHLTALPGLTAVTIHDAAASRGAAGLQATGRLTADAAGLAQGEIRLTLTRWREALDQAEALSLIPAEARPRFEAALSALPPAAAASGRNEAVEIPLRLAQGNIWLGPLALGPAPRLR